MPILWLFKTPVVFVGPWNTSVAPSAFPSVNHFSASSCGRTWGCEASSWSPCHRYVHDCSWLIFLLIYEDSWWFHEYLWTRPASWWSDWVAATQICFDSLFLTWVSAFWTYWLVEFGIKDPKTADDPGEFRVTHGQSSSTPSTSSCKISTSAVGIIVPFQRKRGGVPKPNIVG